MEKRTLLGIVAVILPPLVYSFYRFAIGVLVPSFESTYSIGDATAGEIISASVGMVALGVFLGGLLAPKLGDERTILAGMVVFSAFEGAMALAQGLAEFSAWFFVSSFGIGMVITPSYGVMASLLPSRRGLAVSLLSTAYSSGAFVGPSLAGYLVVYRGWHAPFAALALIGVAFTTFFVLMFGRPEEGRRGGRPIAYGKVLRNRMVLALAVADLFADLGFLVFVSWTPKYLISSFDVVGGGTASVDIVFGVGVGLGGIGALAAGALFDKTGGKRSILVCGSLSALSFAALYLARPLSLALGLVLVAGFFSNTFWPLFTAMAQVSAPKEQVPSATSLVQTTGFIGAFLGPGIAGVMGGAESSALILTTVIPYAVFLLIVLSTYRDPAQKLL